jgi:hypothetical protein
MKDINAEDALNFLIDHLAALNEVKPGMTPEHGRRPYGSDVYVADVAAAYWQMQAVRIRDLPGNQAEAYARPFYDAAWELCRRGVLRPGQVAPLGHSSSGQFVGDGYALTAWGEQWVKKAATERAGIPSDPGRLGEVLLQHKELFGDGYAQRAAEAVSDYRSSNYLSACVMAGAAAESILLATAIAKEKDEGKVLAEYRSTGGRARVTTRITSGGRAALEQRFAEGLGVLSYWRDDAGHGMASTIGEIEAHEALTRLLRLAQFTSDNWIKLTG